VEDPFISHRPLGYEQYMKLVWTNYWPNNIDLFDKARHIYAGAQVPYSFKTRTIESVIDEIIHYYQVGMRIFIFENLSEGVMIPDLDKISTISERVSDLPDISILYWCGDYNAELSVNRHFNDKPVSFKTIGVSHFEYMGHTYPLYDKEYVVGTRSKKFLCFNKVHRQHRIDFLNYVVQNNLLDDSYFSFDREGGVGDLEQLIACGKYEGIKTILNQLPLVLNKTPERANPVDIIEDDHKYFENSYFSVITETLFYDPTTVNAKYGHSLHVVDTYLGNFLSEKTFKAIRMKHPFVMIGPPNSLAFLKSKGYKSFDLFIDESYDTIHDDIQRMQKICTEVNRLCNLPHEELVKFTEYAKDIVEHNYNVLCNVNNFTTTGDLRSILNI
jgi:hypothetical protein